MIQKSVQGVMAVVFTCAVAGLPAAASPGLSGPLADLNPLPEPLQQRQKVSVEHVSAERAFDASSGKMVLVLHYMPPAESPLAQSTELAAWVSLNGRDGFFGMKHDDRAKSFDLEVANAGFDCEPARARGSDCEQTTRNMRNVFYWARRGNPSNPNGKLNAWDIEVAFVTPEGVWDNANGRNYRLRFDE